MALQLNPPLIFESLKRWEGDPAHLRTVNFQGLPLLSKFHFKANTKFFEFFVTFQIESLRWVRPCSAHLIESGQSVTSLREMIAAQCVCVCVCVCVLGCVRVCELIEYSEWALRVIVLSWALAIRRGKIPARG